MEIFKRNVDRGELERASDNFNDMLGQVVRLGEMLAEPRGRKTAVIVERAAA
jgi:hypothetical protein